ncbi:MAG: hypothetical protein V3U98_01445 [Acidobacteriota bacterium]
MASIDTLCPKCDQRLLLQPGAPTPECPHCRQPFPARAPAPPPESPLPACSVCGGSAFYLQKDFNQNLGCLIFLVGAVLAPFTHYLSLLIGLALDLVLYLALPYATVCYTCRSIFRGYPRNPDHGVYDPNTAWAHRPKEGPWAQPRRAHGRIRGNEENSAG